MKLYLLGFLLLIAGTVVFFQIRQQDQEENKDRTITPEEVHARMKQKDTSIVLLDVRTPEEYASATGHIEGALLIPVQELSRRIAELDSVKHRTVIAYCRSGSRSDHAARMLRSNGFNALNMTGGMIRWNQQGFPVRKGAGR